MGAAAGGKGINPEAFFKASMAAYKRGDLKTAIRQADLLLEFSRYAPPALIWATRLRLEARRWPEAIAFGKQWFSKAPGISGLVGYACEETGDLAQAQVWFERAAKEQPENGEWHLRNASALSRLHRDFESMEALRVATKLAPTAKALQILAANELSFANPSAALSAADRAAALDPKSCETQVIAAKSLMLLGSTEQADARWTNAIRLSPSNQSVELQRAVALVRRGQFDAAIGEFRRMIEADARFVPAYVQLVSSKRITEADRPLIAKMEDLLNERFGEEGLIALRFALGKAYDQLKEYGPAMTHFDEGNRLQGREVRESGGFDRAGYSGNMNLRKRIIDRDVVAGVRGGNPSEAPILVMGVIRSGTTLAEQILSSHPQVSGAGEQDFWINADLRLIDYEKERLNLDVLHDSAKVYLRLIGGFAKGASRVVDKQPGNLILAGALHIAFPNARIIYMQRDPLDNAISIWTTNIRTSTRFTNDKANIVFANREHEKLMRHWQNVLPADRFMAISYEALVTDRENLTRRVLDFCGLPWNESCLAPERNTKQVITPSLWQVRQPVYTTSIGRWKNYEPWLGEFRQFRQSTD